MYIKIKSNFYYNKRPYLMGSFYLVGALGSVVLNYLIYLSNVI